MPKKYTAWIERDIDLIFIGWLHTGRGSVVKKIIQDAYSRQLRAFVHLYFGLITMIKKVFQKDDFGLSCRKLEFQHVAFLLSLSKCIVDIQHPLQASLSYRVFESLAHGAKLITTSADIANYPSYNPLNISIQNADSITLDKDFLHSPYQEVPENILSKYGLDNWSQLSFRMVINLAP